MNAYNMIKEDIEAYVKKGLSEHIFYNPQIRGGFFSDLTTITSKYSYFENEDEYKSQYYKKYEANEFLCALSDGSFFQINYEFKRISKNKSYVKKLNLSYMPNVKDNKLVNEYVRVDYDTEVKNSFFHADAHLHIGFNGDIRIPIDEVMLFSEFCSFILYLYYSEDFKKLYNRPVSHTIDKTIAGKVSINKVLSDELSRYLYIRTQF